MALAIERMDRAVDAGGQRTELPDAPAALAQPDRAIGGEMNG